MPKISAPTTFKLEDFGNPITVEDETTTYQAPSGWFKIIQSNHDKKGIEFCLPIEHPKYSKEIQNKLKNLQTGDTIKMSCVSTNERNTAWRVHEILTVSKNNN